MHVLRPLLVVIALVAIVLAIRIFAVPVGFGVYDGGYIYGWYDQSSEEAAKSVEVKYQGREYCQGCHTEQSSKVSSSLHANIQCENCHGPAIKHPSEPPKLTIDTSRDLCLRCHADLPASLSGRSAIKGIDPDNHNPGVNCASCHNPHSPAPGAAK
ncbi:MAG: cytochrome c3 family protein [Bacteroidetes bacterium]|nr:cytochrome c3 family protein [Bacteroidota bacterium]MCL5024928.1 cytochrome c3 family protein [Chloroflexota bacterium]